MNLRLSFKYHYNFSQKIFNYRSVILNFYTITTTSFIKHLTTGKHQYFFTEQKAKKYRIL